MPPIVLLLIWFPGVFDVFSFALVWNESNLEKAARILMAAKQRRGTGSESAVANGAYIA